MSIKEIIYGPRTNDYDAEVYKLTATLYLSAISGGYGQMWIYRTPKGEYEIYSQDPSKGEFIGCIYSGFYDDFWNYTNEYDKLRYCDETANDLFTELDQ